MACQPASSWTTRPSLCPVDTTMTPHSYFNMSLYNITETTLSVLCAAYLNSSATPSIGDSTSGLSPSTSTAIIVVLGAVVSLGGQLAHYLASKNSTTSVTTGDNSEVHVENTTPPSSPTPSKKISKSV